MTLTVLTVPISVGDFIDRLSILTIKNNKDLPVSDELEQYEQQFTELSAYSRFHYLEMFLAVNAQLWGLEDRKRSKLIEEGIDLSIRITNRLEPGDIVRKLGQTRLLTVASPSYLAQHSLAQNACLVYSQDFQSTTWSYGSNEDICNVTVRPRLVANNGEALLQAAANGLGITRPPDFMAQPYLDNGSVVPVLTTFEPEPLGIYAVLPSNRYIPHRVSALIDYLADTLNK